MMIWFVVAYLLVSIGIGLYASRRVHTAKDYIAAGRNLPMYMVIAMVFATWFGAETVLGISATFLKEGMGGLISDPFGAALCLVLFGLFFARKLYRANLLTLGDYYRARYSRPVELLTSIAIVLSYLGWVAAQVTALGLVFNILSAGAISETAGILIGAGVVLVYTLFGGMWSVAMTTFFQMIIIVLGLVFIAWMAGDMAGGVSHVLSHAEAAGKLDFMPEMSIVGWVGFFAALLTMGFGSIPQQDVFQRANASRSESGAVYGSVIGGVCYFFFAAVPLFLAYSATLIDPALVALHSAEGGDTQKILPSLVLAHMPLYAQIIFFGALLSVIMSTASGTLLAPSVTFSENILRGFWKDMTDDQLLKSTRVVVVIFTLLVTGYSLMTESTIHEMVTAAYKVTLACAFVPLVAGLYWQRASNQGALAAIVLGLVAWIAAEFMAPEAVLPPQFVGMFASLFGMVAGSLLPQWIAHQPQVGYSPHHVS